MSFKDPVDHDWIYEKINKVFDGGGEVTIINSTFNYVKLNQVYTWREITVLMSIALKELRE